MVCADANFFNTFQLVLIFLTFGCKFVFSGLLFLISNKIMGMGDNMGDTWAALGKFIGTSIVALLIH